MPDADNFHKNGNAASPLHFAAHHRKNAVRSFAHPVPKNAAGGRHLLVGLPTSARFTAPIGTKQSAQAPYSWGLGASTSSRRRWPAALPPPLLVGRVVAVLCASSRCKGKEKGGSLRRCLAPLGQGALPVCGVDAVCPCGAKALQSGAPDFGWFAGERWMKKRFALQERFGRRARKTKHTVLRSIRPPRPRNHPAGRTAALPAPAQGSRPLRIPFWGTGPVSPVP